MTFKFKRKRILLSEKNKNSKAIGYARATHNEYEYLEEQIKILKEEGCSNFEGRGLHFSVLWIYKFRWRNQTPTQ